LIVLFIILKKHSIIGQEQQAIIRI
jgi:hypothetical protein